MKDKIKQKENVDMATEKKEQIKTGGSTPPNKEDNFYDKKAAGIESIRNIRIRMDATLDAMNKENNSSRSRELALACTSFQLARMWFGKALMTLGEAGYVNDGNRKTVADIEAPTDKATRVYEDMPTERIPLLDFLRGDIRDINTRVKAVQQAVALGPHVAQQTTVNLMEAVMWLGADLGRIYKENKAKNSE